MITLTREEAQQVLEHLDDLTDFQQWDIDMHVTQYGEKYKPHRVKHMKEQLANTNSTIETLRARLSAPEPEPEPVAWLYMGIKQDGTTHGPHLCWKPEYMDVMSENKGAVAEPLYTLLPKPKLNVKPAAYVPVHPKSGPLWSMTTDDPNTERLPSYPLMNLYTAPPQREWQGLTEAERLDILDAEITTQSTEHFALAQAIEAKLKEKNT